MSTDLKSRIARFSRILGLIGPLVAYAFIGVSIYLNPWFSLEGHALSELGDLRKKYCKYPWFYNLGLELSGIIMAFFAVGLLLKSERFSQKLASTLILAGSISLALIGFFPSGTHLHGPVTAAFYLLTPFGLFMFALTLLRRNLLLSLIMVFTIASSIVMASVPRWHGAAIPELIGAVGITICIWILCLNQLKVDSERIRKSTH